MKKVKYSKGLAKRAFPATSFKRNVDSRSALFTAPIVLGNVEIAPVKIDDRAIADQVAASMAIEARVIKSEDIVIASTEESRKAVNDVLMIRVRDRQRYRPDGSTGEPRA